MTYAMIDMGQGHGVGDGKSTLIFLLEDDIRRFLVESYAKSFQLALDNLLICQRLVHV